MSTPHDDQEIDSAITGLLTRASARASSTFARVVKTHGLSLTEWRVCATLLHTPDQTLSELAVNAVTDLSALSRIVDRLTERRLVRRRRSINDKRSVLVALSTKGVALTRAIVPVARHHEAIALADFEASEICVLREMLQRLCRRGPPAP